MEKLYKVIYTKISTKDASEIFRFSTMFTDKAKAVKKCEQFAQVMRNIDHIVSRYKEADLYIWIREYEDRDGEMKPVGFYPYESIEDGVLKTSHLSVHYEYFNAK